ncbi:MAG: hypothetical protein HC915_00690 [Anaerolineae bacterium]|nr:hypothetical protein [Anaerolineae bacterium]
MPNPGVQRALRENDDKWKKSPIPVVVHLVAESAERVAQAVQVLDRSPNLTGIELGLHDEVELQEVHRLIGAVARQFGPARSGQGALISGDIHKVL